MPPEKLKYIVEAALFAADAPLSADRLLGLLAEQHPEIDMRAIHEALGTLHDEWSVRGVELSEVASGYRFQVRREYSPYVSRLWAERPARYSRALLETLALIAYRQPITRGEIEDVRGVAVSTPIIRTLQEREWIRVVGHREVPGRPAMFGTTLQFLDYFNLKSLDGLPPLDVIRDLDRVQDDLFGGAEPAAAKAGKPLGAEPADDASAAGTN